MKNNNSTFEQLIEEEIEYVFLIEAQTGIAQLIKAPANDWNHFDQEQYNYNELAEKYILQRTLIEDHQMCEQFATYEKLDRYLKENTAGTLTFRIVDKMGITRRKHARARRLKTDRNQIVISIRDITELYEEEQKQKETLRKAVEAANAANKAKSRFLSRMSHDMRTPLTAILAMSGDELTEDATEEQTRDFLKKIHASGDYLLGIINDVLDMSKIESNQMLLQPEPYYLDDFIKTIHTIIDESCLKKNITFRLEIGDYTPYWLLLDKVRFNQIFVNLLSNAVKFTTKGGEVKLQIIKLGEENDSVHFRFKVCDNGIGMSEEFLPQMYESFTQERSRGAEQNNQGTGLGLAIVKQLVSLMGGKITVESQLKMGTTFTIDLDVETTQEPAKEQLQQTSYSRIKGMKILLCEDYPMNAQIISGLLEKKGGIVRCAENGAVGLQLFTESEICYYDIILMDIRMPVMDGLETTRAIRETDRADACSVPIVALTADAFNEDEQISKGAGMNGFLSKPIDSELLYFTLLKLTNRLEGVISDNESNSTD